MIAFVTNSVTPFAKTSVSRSVRSRNDLTHNALRNIFGTTEFVSKGGGVVRASKHLCKASEGLSGVEVLEKPYHVDRNASKSLSLLLWSAALCAQSNPLFIQLAQLSLLLVVLSVPHDLIDISPYSRLLALSFFGLVD